MVLNLKDYIILNMVRIYIKYSFNLKKIYYFIIEWPAGFVKLTDIVAAEEKKFNIDNKR